MTNDTPCTCGRTAFCPQDCDNMTASEFLSKTQVNHICTCHMRNEYTFCPPGNCQREAVPDKDELIEKLKTFLQMYATLLGSEEFCLVEDTLKYIQATPQPQQSPAKEEIIETMDDLSRSFEEGKYVVFWDLTNLVAGLLMTMQDNIHVVDGKGRRFCTCDQQFVDLSHRPDIAQAAQDSDAEAQTIPMPSGPQCKALGVPELGDLLKRASLDQRQRIEVLVPEFKRKVTEIVRILIRKT